MCSLTITDLQSSIGYIISAIFICAEYQRLGIHNRNYRVLRMSFWIKLAFIFVEIGLVIGFGVCSYKKIYNVAAVLEWTVSLVYIFYVWYVAKPMHFDSSANPHLCAGASFSTSSLRGTPSPKITDSRTSARAPMLTPSGPRRMAM